MPNIPQAIAALTYDQIEQHFDDGTVRQGIGVPLLQRSISQDLIRIDKTLGGSSVLRAIAHSIDEALLALVEDLDENERNVL